MTAIINFLKWLFSGTWLKKNKPTPAREECYTIEVVRDFPDTPEALKIYLVGKPDDPLLAGMDCPCKCGQFIELVIKGDHPRWSITTSADGKPTLRPSVWRTVGCGSHFFLTDGKVIWCKP